MKAKTCLFNYMLKKTINFHGSWDKSHKVPLKKDWSAACAWAPEPQFADPMYYTIIIAGQNNKINNFTDLFYFKAIFKWIFYTEPHFKMPELSL